ncbi:MAG: C39 family peptidase [Oscillospiraceae bacterium]
MKSIKKVFICTLAAITMAAPISVFADNAVTISGAIEATEEEIAASKNQIKPKYIGAIEATEEEIAASKNQKKTNTELEKAHLAERMNAPFSWHQLSPMSSFVYYPQETNYTCGPASLRMALNFLTGINYPESTLSTCCGTSTAGTSLTKMAECINSKQSKNGYVARYGETKETMKDNIYSGIVTNNAPPIIGVKETRSSGWPFDLEKHFIVVHSVTSDESEVGVADSWSGFKGDYTHISYDISTDDLFLGYDEYNIGYMY